MEEEAEGAGAGVMPDDVDASGTVPPAAGLRTAAGGIRVEDDGGGLDAAPFVVDREDEPPKIEGTLSCTGCISQRKTENELLLLLVMLELLLLLLSLVLLLSSFPFSLPAELFPEFLSIFRK